MATWGSTKSASQLRRLVVRQQLAEVFAKMPKPAKEWWGGYNYLGTALFGRYVIGT